MDPTIGPCGYDTAYILRGLSHQYAQIQCHGMLRTVGQTSLNGISLAILQLYEMKEVASSMVQHYLNFHQMQAAQHCLKLYAIFPFRGRKQFNPIDGAEQPVKQSYQDLNRNGQGWPARFGLLKCEKC